MDPKPTTKTCTCTKRFPGFPTPVFELHPKSFLQEKLELPILTLMRTPQPRQQLQRNLLPQVPFTYSPVTKPSRYITYSSQLKFPKITRSNLPRCEISKSLFSEPIYPVASITLVLVSTAYLENFAQIDDDTCANANQKFLTQGTNCKGKHSVGTDKLTELTYFQRLGRNGTSGLKE